MFLTATLPSSAVSQTPESTALADSAQALWDAGTAAYEMGTVADLKRAIGLWTRQSRLSLRLGNLADAAFTLSSIGSIHSALGRADSALASYHDALVLAREAGDQRSEGVILNNIGLEHDDLGRPDSALVYYGKALEMHREVGHRSGEGTTLNNIGSLLEGIGERDSALVYFGEALEIDREVGDRFGEGVTLNNIGAVHDALGRPDSALVYYGEALAMAREVGDRSGEGLTLNNIGLVHQALGRPDSALVYYGDALAIVREAGDRAAEGTMLSGIGAVHDALGRPDSALAYYGEALATAREVDDRAGEGTALNNIGSLLAAIAERDSALVYLGEALEIEREVSNRSGEGVTLGNIGALHDALGRPDSALVYYGEALAIAREVGDRFREGTRLGNIGSLLADIAERDSALVYLGEALAVAREVDDRFGEGVTLSNLSFVYHRSFPTPDLSKALAYYDSAVVTRARIAKASGSDANRLSYSEQDVALYEDWALAWLAMPVGADGEGARLAALAASERGRSQALLDLMRATSEIEVGRDMTAEGRELIAPLTESGVPGLSWLITQDTLLTWLIDPSGHIHLARRAIWNDSLETIVAELRLGLGVDGAAGEARLAGRADRRFEDIRGTEARRRGGELAEWPSESALELSELLLPEEFRALLPESGELVLVPHGPLNLIPFATLPFGEQNEPLGARYALRFAPSLATLGEAEARPGAAARGGVEGRATLSKTLVVGNPGMPEVPGVDGPVSLSPLPGAEAEGRWVADLVGTDLLTGPLATERTVREQLPEASLIHLATHGFAYSTGARARDSFVALAPGAEHDGLLTVGEVLDDPTLQLAAELVVLSACQTGLGDLTQSEGTVGLQRAFLARGARSVLVSLWSVSDEATDLLMRGFYRHWLQDDDAPSKAEALRRAQEDVRATPGFEHPRFWAAFQLVGAR